ncbi:hypothetical protein BJY52DRAFT_1291992 [Lactarius psammicola]|nr:hypothetical protein BJY52DRAFT_1291992 [Lactarius psammicola]
MPEALASVSVETIQKWEHQMKRWIEAYQGGPDVKWAQFRVIKTFSSRCRYISYISSSLRSYPENAGSRWGRFQQSASGVVDRVRQCVSCSKLKPYSHSTSSA